MHTRPVGLVDIDVLSRLARQAFIETFSHLYSEADLASFLESAYAPEALAKEVSNPRHDWLMVWDEDTPVGYLQCAPVGLPHPEANPSCEGEIKRVYVLASHQGRGLGKMLMTRALQWLTDRYGRNAQWIGVWSLNHKAQALYHAYGFEKAGEYIFRVGEAEDEEYIFRRQP